MSNQCSLTFNAHISIGNDSSIATQVKFDFLHATMSRSKITVLADIYIQTKLFLVLHRLFILCLGLEFIQYNVVYENVRAPAQPPPDFRRLSKCLPHGDDSQS